MHPAELFNNLLDNDIGFFTGIPDSLLKNFCAYVTDHTNNNNHIIAANEGGAIALATGYYLATGKLSLVYLQNSGLGNTINPLLSLADKEVYGIPMVLMIGWRGEPGIKDEPQHIKQGRVQNSILDAIEIPYMILDEDTQDIASFVTRVVKMAKDQSCPVAIVVKKNSFESYKLLNIEKNAFDLTREEAIEEILAHLNSEDVVISTTGKTSREVFEIRVKNGMKNDKDFLTVGSMGHANQIALGIALNTRNRRVYCIDGDGAVLMHMGSLAIIGTSDALNYIHIVINNGGHESVGGQPTVAPKIDLIKMAKACGYKNALSVANKLELKKALYDLSKMDGPIFIEIKTRMGARANLGRPTKTPIENKDAFMKNLSSKK